MLPEDRDPLCISYTLPETAYSNCVRKLREKHCPKSEPKVARQPFQMSVRSLSGRSDDPGFFQHTNFRAAFKFYSCVEENSAEKGKLLSLTISNVLNESTGSDEKNKNVDQIISWLLNNRRK